MTTMEPNHVFYRVREMEKNKCTRPARGFCRLTTMYFYIPICTTISFLSPLWCSDLQGGAIICTLGILIITFAAIEVPGLNFQGLLFSPWGPFPENLSPIGEDRDPLYGLNIISITFFATPFWSYLEKCLNVEFLEIGSKWLVLLSLSTWNFQDMVLRP